MSTELAVPAPTFVPVEPEQVARELATCETAADVARFLRRQNVQGKRSSSIYCPIARLFNMRTGRQHIIGIAGWEEVNETEEGRIYTVQSGELPESVRDFIVAFDDGDFNDRAFPGTFREEMPV